MFTGSALKNLKMRISKSGNLTISHNDYPYEKLSDFEKYFFSDKEVGFINSFLFNKISVEKDVTISDILKSFIPWKNEIEKIIDINIDSYIYYINNYKCNDNEYSKWEKIEFVKKYRIKEINKLLISIEELINKKRDINKYRQFTGYVNIEENNANLIYFYNAENVLSSFSGDPLIDVSTYKNIPVILNSDGIIESPLFSSESEGSFLAEDSYGKKTIKFNTKNEFYFIDLLKHMSSLLYFYEPLNSDRKSENYRKFSENFKKISDNENFDFKSDSSIIWEDFIKKNNNHR